MNCHSGMDGTSGGSSSGLLNAIVGGWDTNWILTLQDGQPGTVPCAIATTAGFGCYALRVPGVDLYAGKHNADQWMNPAAFTTPPVATQIGQTDYSPLGGGPSQFRGPGFHRMDLSLFKQFQLSERFRLEFRSEFFNLANHPNFSVPGFPIFGFQELPLEHWTTTIQPILERLIRHAMGKTISARFSSR